LQKLERVKKTPLEYYMKVRQWKDLCNLSQTKGHAIHQKRLLQSILGPKIAKKVQYNNANLGQNILALIYFGDKNALVQSRHMLQRFVCGIEIKSIIDSPSMGFARKKVCQLIWQNWKYVGLEVVLEVVDNIQVFQEMDQVL